MLMQLILFQEVYMGVKADFIVLTGLRQWIYTNTDFLPLIPAIIVVGGFIIFTLSYVSWRKYQAERQKLKRKKDNIVD